MADGRKNNGGKRVGAGRKTKAEEQRAIEKINAVVSDALVLQELNKLVKAGDFRAIQLALYYKFGKPAETMDLNAKLEATVKDSINITINPMGIPKELE